MTPSGSRRTWIIIAAVALALGITIALLSRREPNQVVMFHGTSIRLHQVSYGTKHTFVSGPVWHRMLAIMPTNVTRALGIYTRVETTKEPTLMIWFECKGGTPPHPCIRLRDSNGLLSDSHWIDRTVQDTNRFYCGFVLNYFPPDQKEFVAELSTPGGNHRWPGLKPFAEFHIANPGYRRTRTREQKIQLTAQADGEKFTLLGLNTGLYATGDLAQESFSNQWTELVFRIGTNEPAQRSFQMAPVDRGPWEIVSIELRDSYGNVLSEPGDRGYPYGHIYPLGDGFGSRLDDGIALVRGAIWPSGNWKVRATFRRAAIAATDEGRLWITTIPLRKRIGTTSISQTGRIETAQVSLESIEDVGEANLCSLSIRLDPPANGLRIVQLQDQRGTNLVCRYRRPDPVEQTVDFEESPESTSLQIIFAVRHPVTVEFSSPVTILRTNVVHWPLPEPSLIGRTN